VDRFFADIDTGRDFDDDTATGYCLTWLAGPGFSGLMREHGMKWHDALEFRQRYLLEALRKRSI
jgi:hypothetical protein